MKTVSVLEGNEGKPILPEELEVRCEFSSLEEYTKAMKKYEKDGKRASIAYSVNSGESVPSGLPRRGFFQNLLRRLTGGQTLG